MLAEFSAARDCIAFAKQHVHDLDEGLSSSQRAELLAYSVLIQTRLETATLVSGWCEPVGCAESRKVSACLFSFHLSKKYLRDAKCGIKSWAECSWQHMPHHAGSCRPCKELCKVAGNSTQAASIPVPCLHRCWAKHPSLSTTSCHGHSSARCSASLAAWTWQRSVLGADRGY